MDCLDCKGRLRVTHSHTAAGRSRAARAVCEKCNAVHTLATTVLRADARGAGAKALSKKFAAGTARLWLEDDGEAVQDSGTFSADEQGGSDEPVA